MPKLTFFPLGNADCCLCDLNNGKKMLFDYAATRCGDDKNDKRIDLPKALRDDLNAAERDYYDVVAFSHLDLDHIKGASEFFYLEHSSKFQSKDRIKINELWVPAAVIVEDKDSLGEEHSIIQAEARYRLRNRRGIRVFSRPELLRDWLAKQGMKLDDLRNLITDAGQLVPGFSLSDDGVEFFVHSPFAKRINECEVVDRNSDSLVLQATFDYNGTQTKLILGADTPHEIWTEIVDITRAHKRDERLEWDVFKLPHHCSYLSLGPEKGKEKTVPVPNVKWLFEEKGNERGIVVSTSDIIPSEDTDQPPHRQAANYHKEHCLKRVRKLNAICDESTCQAEKGIAALSSFFPIDNQSAKSVEPSVSSLHDPTASLTSRMSWSVIWAPVLRSDMRRVVLAAQSLSRLLIIESRV